VSRIVDGHLAVAAAGRGAPGCQNSEDDTLPCTNSTGGPVRPGTDSTLTVSRLVGTRSAPIPGNSVSTLLLRAVIWAAAPGPPQKLAEIVVVSLKALQ
jgi:hypothetical protein